jgi:hypothetical protein
MKHIVCYSGGHSSAIVAIEVARRYGPANTILLNHDINSNVEIADIKRFKQQVAAYLGIEITYANMPGYEELDQFDVCIAESAFKAYDKTAICTNRLKTRPFEKFLASNFPANQFRPSIDCIIYYGFDRSEMSRIQRRSSHLALLGYRTDFPLALWKERTIEYTWEVGVDAPNVYENFKHANCVGCLKAGKQHWYCVYCLRPDVFGKAKMAEAIIKYSILRWETLEELEPMFARMKCAGIEPSEADNPAKFWANAKRVLSSLVIPSNEDEKPCECIL